MVEDLEGPRREESPFVLGERDMLEAWLESRWTTLLLKRKGRDDGQPDDSASRAYAALGSRHEGDNLLPSRPTLS